MAAIVRALCQAANAGPDLLYEVMLKLSLVVEATAPMYGLSMWRVEHGQKPKLKWAEGLDEPELVKGESLVNEMLTPGTAWPWCGRAIRRSVWFWLRPGRDVRVRLVRSVRAAADGKTGSRPWRNHGSDALGPCSRFLRRSAFPAQHATEAEDELDIAGDDICQPGNERSGAHG